MPALARWRSMAAFRSTSTARAAVAGVMAWWGGGGVDARGDPRGVNGRSWGRLQRIDGGGQCELIPLDVIEFGGALG